ncbi:MAG: riboflavin synthase [Polyangiaceae bacterium]|nr:riboflavin synthase [Polyangiaceae bacterium]
MFTGLVEELGVVARLDRRGPSATLVVSTTLGGLALGDSVAVDGACLTVTRLADGSFSADCSAETLAHTTLGALGPGARVHLERALLPTTRLGGHLVSGHVDGRATLVSVEPVGDARKLTLRAPAELSRFVARKGSVALDGVSLTVNGVDGDGFDVMIIPHTADKTKLASLRPGDALNLEVDLLARYVARLLEPAPDDRLRDALRRAGYGEP